MNFTVRQATEGDIPDMYRIRLGVRENRLSDNSAIDQDAYVPFVESGDACVAQADCNVVGFAALAAGSASVWALFVDPGAEGSGIGRLLHDWLIDRAAALGLSRLTLSTTPGTRADRFYRALDWAGNDCNADGELVLERAITPA